PHRQNVHAVDLHAGYAVGLAAQMEVGPRRGALDAGTHAVLVVLDDVDDRQLPQRRHVEGLVHLALIDGTVAEIGDADAAVIPVSVAEGEAGAERHLGSDNAMAAVELFLAAEHVHGAALAPGIAAAPSRELGHHAFGVHAAGQHVAVIAIAGDNAVARRECRLHAHDDRLLPDVEMAEAADQAHAVELARLLLEAADQQHVAIVVQQFGLIRFCVGVGPSLAFGSSRHGILPKGTGDDWLVDRKLTASSPENKAAQSVDTDCKKHCYLESD